MTIEKTFRQLGYTEDVCSCDCCGRENLKGTYAIENLETGEILFFGSACAAHRMNWSVKKFKETLKAEEREQIRAARFEYTTSKEYSTYSLWLNGLDNRFDSTDAGFMARMAAVKEEQPQIDALLEWRRSELKEKYPLVKYIY